MDDQERQYEEFARRAQERRRMVEARRLGLEQRMRERQQVPEPDAPAWWDDEEEAPPAEELESPWIEEHEAPLGFPARREEAPRATLAVPMQRQAPASERRRRLMLLESREGLRQAILAREVLGPPVALRRADEGLP